MAKSIKLKNDIYLDSSGVTHNKKLVNEILNNISDTVDFHGVSSYADINEFLEKFKTYNGYKVHIGYMTFGGQNSLFIGFLQTYLNGYGKVLVLSTWNNYLCTLNNGTWSTNTLSIL